jgi:hypothetical protein
LFNKILLFESNKKQNKLKMLKLISTFIIVLLTIQQINSLPLNEKVNLDIENRFSDNEKRDLDQFDALESVDADVIMDPPMNDRTHLRDVDQIEPIDRTNSEKRHLHEINFGKREAEAETPEVTDSVDERTINEFDSESADGSERQTNNKRHSHFINFGKREAGDIPEEETVDVDNERNVNEFDSEPVDESKSFSNKKRHNHLIVFGKRDVEAESPEVTDAADVNEFDSESVDGSELQANNKRHNHLIVFGKREVGVPLEEIVDIDNERDDQSKELNED